MNLKSFLLNPFSICKKRNHFFDLLKLFAILLVILDHSLQRWVICAQDSQLYNFIFLTQMPLFMFVSGYFFFKTINRCSAPKDYLILFAKISISLLIPFVSFSLIKGFFVTTSPKDYFIFFLNCFVQPQLSLWFLLALFWMQTLMLLSSFIIYFFKKKNDVFVFIFRLIFFLILLTPFILLFILKKDILDAKIITYYSLFFLLGFSIFFAKNKNLLSFLKNIIWQLVVTLVSLGVLIVIMIFNPHFIYSPDDLMHTAIRAIGSVCNIIVCCFAFYYISKLSFMKIISYGGCFTLELYFVHLFLFLLPLFETQIALDSFIHFLTFMGFYLLTVLSSFAVAIALKTNVFTDFVFFGKVHKKDKN